MGINIFKKKYKLRKYFPQTVDEDGYVSAQYTDVNVLLNVQPLNADDLQALPEGERTVKRIKSFGTDKIIAADQYSGTQGDRLLYNGKWYECTSAQSWDHTVLAHYECQFTIIQESEMPESGIRPFGRGVCNECRNT